MAMATKAVAAFSVVEHRPDDVAEPWGEPVILHDIVENDLEWPRGGKAHRCLHQHGEQDYE
jgi:hypothetical protein